MGLRPAAPSRGGRRRGSGARSGALDRTRHANGGPLAAAPLPLPARATAPAHTDLRPAAELIATIPADGVRVSSLAPRDSDWYEAVSQRFPPSSARAFAVRFVL